jgi:hypothetical protein
MRRGPGHRCPAQRLQLSAQKWAATEYNLGAALVDLGERESGTEHLTQTVSAYQVALKEYTRNTRPIITTGRRELTADTLI